jgi:hypothetical protein
MTRASTKYTALACSAVMAASAVPAGAATILSLSSGGTAGSLQTTSPQVISVGPVANASGSGLGGYAETAQGLFPNGFSGAERYTFETVAASTSTTRYLRQEFGLGNGSFSQPGAIVEASSTGSLAGDAFGSVEIDRFLSSLYIESITTRPFRPSNISYSYRYLFSGRGLTSTTSVSGLDIVGNVQFEQLSLSGFNVPNCFDIVCNLSNYSPAPNTVLINVPNMRVVLNEQIWSESLVGGILSRSLQTTAISVQTFELGMLNSVVTTNMFLGRSFASVSGIQPVVAPPVSGVPEPATWAMLIAGFGLVGAVERRRNRAVTA